MAHTKRIDNARQEERERVQGAVGSHVQEHCGSKSAGHTCKPLHQRLTSNPGLPVEQTCPDVVPPEVLTGRTVLVVRLQATYDDGPLSLSQELRCVREVLDDPEGHEARDYGNETLNNEDPRPGGLSADAFHI